MFQYYLKEVLDNELIEDSDALGIARQIIKQGAENLTEKQWYVFLKHGVGEVNYVSHSVVGTTKKFHGKKCLVRCIFTRMVYVPIVDTKKKRRIDF
ncbi:hypothetical protein ACTWKC_17750 [Bacillus sp. 4A_MP3]